MIVREWSFDKCKEKSEKVSKILRQETNLSGKVTTQFIMLTNAWANATLAINLLKMKTMKEGFDAANPILRIHEEL